MPDSPSTTSELTAEQLAAEHAAHVKAREFDFEVQVNFPRRVILTVFPPLIAILLTYSTEIHGQRYGFGDNQQPMDWHEHFLYWPTCSFVIAVYLWILWAPKSGEEA